jgi:hypothetical protein
MQRTPVSTPTVVTVFTKPRETRRKLATSDYVTNPAARAPFAAYSRKRSTSTMRPTPTITISGSHCLYSA